MEAKEFGGVAGGGPSIRIGTMSGAPLAVRHLMACSASLITHLEFAAFADQKSKNRSQLSISSRSLGSHSSPPRNEKTSWKTSIPTIRRTCALAVTSAKSLEE